MIPSRQRLLMSAVIALSIAAMPRVLSAVDSPTSNRKAKSSRADKPIFVMNFAGADRLLAGSDAVLKLAERADLSLALRSVIAISTGGLRGVDRRKPFGVMTLINPGDIPEPVAVAYIPMRDQDDLIAVLKNAGVEVKPVKGRDGRFHLSFQNFPLAMRVLNGYAFVARQQKSLSRPFTDPATQFQSLTKIHDVAIQIPLADIPNGMRTMILDYFRARGELADPRRRGESRSEHALRRAVTNASLTGLESLLTQGESLTIGMTVAKSGPPITIDLTVVARENTRLAQTFAATRNGGLGGSASLPSAKSAIPFWLACRFRLPQSGRAMLSAWITQVVENLLPDRPKERSAESPVAVAMNSLLCDSQTSFSIRTVGFGETQQWIAAVQTIDAEKTASQIKAALKLLQRNGVVRGVENGTMPETNVSVSRISWGDSRAEVAFDGRIIRIAFGAGDLSKRLAKEIKSAKRVAADRQRATLLALSFQARLLGSDERDRNSQSQGKTESDTVRFRIDQNGRRIHLRATLASDAVRRLSKLMAIPSR